MSGHVSPLTEAKGHWTAATLLSLTVHAAAFAWLLGLVPSFIPPPPQEVPETVITVSNAMPEIETVEGVGPALTAATQVETLQPLEPAPLTPVSPEVEEGQTPDTETATEAAAPESAAQAAAPETAPTPATSQALAPVTPDQSAAAGASQAPMQSGVSVGTLSPGALTPVAPAATDGVQSAIAIDPPADTGAGGAQAESQPPRASASPAGPAADPALLALIERIRGRLDDPCLVALPRPQVAPLGPLVLTLADQDVTANRFAEAVLSDPDLPVDAQTILVDARQCPALTFLRGRAAYPAFQLGLDLARTQLASGETMVGRLEGAAGAYTSLILVDDNGVVQDLRRFLRFTGGRAEFAIPVTRDGPPRETAQLLIALATPTRPETLTERAGRLASDIFPLLGEELGPNARISVQIVDVR